MPRQIRGFEMTAIAAIMVAASAASAQEQSGADRPIEHWITRAGEEAEIFAANDKDEKFSQVLLGVGVCCGDHPGKISLFKNKKAQFPHRAAAVDAFRAFMKERGYSLLRKWRTGQALNAHEARYQSIIQMVYLRKGFELSKKMNTSDRLFVLKLTEQEEQDCLQYFRDVEEEGLAAVKKGYMTGGLSSEDFDDLRMFHRQNWARCIGKQYLPIALDLSKDGPWLLPFRYGTEAPDLELPWLESVMAWSTYSDTAKPDYGLTHRLRPEGVLKYLRIMNGYDRAESKEQGVLLSAKPKGIPDGQLTDYFRLSSFRGKKPVVFIFSSPADGSAPLKVLSGLEVLQRAYRDKVEFVYIPHVIQDIYEGGLAHEWSLEERARSARLMFMQYPHITFGCALEDLAETAKNAYHRNKCTFVQQRHVIVDIDGRIVSLGQWCGAGTLVRNQIESDLQRLLRNDGKANRGRQAWIPAAEYLSRNIDAQKDCIWSYTTLPKRKTLIIENANILALDKKTGDIRVEATLRNGKKEYLVRTSGLTRFLGGDNLHYGYRCSEFGELREGMVIGRIHFWADTLLGENVTVEPTPALKKKGWQRHLRGMYSVSGPTGNTIVNIKGSAYGLPLSPINAFNIVVDDDSRGILEARMIIGGSPIAKPEALIESRARIWLSGYVVEIDKKGRIITVEQDLPPEDEMKGYRFWKQADWKVDMDFGSISESRQRLEIVKGWVKRSKEGPIRYRFLVGDGCDLLISGEFDHGFTELSVGDRIGVKYQCYVDPEEVIYPEEIRISKALKASN